MSIKFVSATIILMIIFYVFGALSYRSDLFPFKQLKDWYHTKKVNAAQRINLDLSHFNNEEFTVIFAFGQSNSANYGQTIYECTENVFNWNSGKIYKAKDPLIGAGGFGGSPWTRLGDLMIQNKLAQKVLLISIGRGGTTVSNWAEGSKLHKLLANTVHQLKNQGIHIDYIFWHQGETDNQKHTSTETYVEKFKTIRKTFRDNKVDAPIFVATASYIPVEKILLDKNNGCDPNIQNAQKKLAALFPDIYPGADTDSMDKSYYRNDGLHFSDAGLWKHAELWMEIIKQHKN